jgi:glycosyltransferase involved in cell wall biosynthesis
MKVFTVIPTHKITDKLFKICSVVSNPIVVLDGFSDSKFNELLGTVNQNAIVIRTAVGGNAYIARNVGIDVALAKGADYILFTDSDCVPDKDWESNMIKGGGDILVGWTIEHTESKLLQVYRENPYGLGTNGIKFFCCGMIIFPTCNVGYSKLVFRALGRFPEVPGGDLLFSEKVYKNFSVELKRNAIVNHYICSGIKELFLKRVRYGPFVVKNPLISIVAIFAIFINSVSSFFVQLMYASSKKDYYKLWCFLVGDMVVHYGFLVGRLKHILGFKNKKVV